MLLAQLEAFSEVARLGNVSRAAKTLSVTQPALTARLQGLERELEVDLFVRGARGMTLTDAGRALHRRGAGREHLRSADPFEIVPDVPPPRPYGGADRPHRGGPLNGAAA